jgi:signal peptide peptidase SppA
MNLHLEAEIRAGIFGLSESHMEGLARSAFEFDAASARRAIAARPQKAIPRAPAGIAVVRVHGPLSQHPSLFQDWIGGCSTTQIGAALRAAVQDDSIGQILLEFNSEGGSISGVETLASEIRAARAVKPVVGIANSVAARATYWSLAQCDELWCAPGAEVGGVGVVAAHEDCSAALAMSGVNVTLISAGKFKTEGNPYGPLDSETQAFMRQRVNEVYRTMTSGIARGRGTSVDAVRNGFGQGRVVAAEAAVAAGMVDGVMSYAQVLQRMVRSSRVARPPAHSAAMQQNRRLLDGLQ